MKLKEKFRLIPEIKEFSSLLVSPILGNITKHCRTSAKFLTNLFKQHYTLLNHFLAKVKMNNYCEDACYTVANYFTNKIEFSKCSWQTIFRTFLWLSLLKELRNICEHKFHQSIKIANSSENSPTNTVTFTCVKCCLSLII